MTPTRLRRQERRFRRRAVRVLVDYRSSEGIRCEYATTLGAGGLFIATEECLEIGSPLRLRFRLPESDCIHEIEGRVVWHHRATSGESATRAPGMGIEFVDATAAAALARDLDETR
jgi:uncharacterized protein (TIGR02266 family)